MSEKLIATENMLSLQCASDMPRTEKIKKRECAGEFSTS